MPTTRRPPSSSPRPARPASRDPQRLYQRAVQDPASEIAVVERLLRRSGRPPRHLREDFSGAAAVAAAWVERGPERTAIAVDLDPGVHDWARQYRVPAMGDAARRLRLVNGDVRRGPGRDLDAVLALNFSYGVFGTRDALRGYFAAARRALAPGGVLVLDAFGGWDAQKPLVERRRIGHGVRYVWEQESFDPITHRMRCAIHFEFDDGARLRRAFRYDWRLWTLPELSELLREAAFDEVEVLWDVAGRGATRYVPRRGAENQAGWIAYVVGRRAARPLRAPGPRVTARGGAGSRRTRRARR